MRAAPCGYATQPPPQTAPRAAPQETQLPTLASLTTDQKFMLYCHGFARLSTARRRVRKWGILDPRVSEEDAYLSIQGEMRPNGGEADAANVRLVNYLMGMSIVKARPNFKAVRAEPATLCGTNLAATSANDSGTNLYASSDVCGSAPTDCPANVPITEDDVFM